MDVSTRALNGILTGAGAASVHVLSCHPQLISWLRCYLWRRGPRSRPRREEFEQTRTWMARIFRDSCLDHCRLVVRSCVPAHLHSIYGSCSPDPDQLPRLEKICEASSLDVFL
jgi:hypothetical protein